MQKKQFTLDEKSLYKKEHKTLRLDIINDIIAIRSLKTVSDEKKEELMKDLLAKKEASETDCPFPNHKWYREVWSKLTSKQQEEMKKNIRISADGKVEIIPMKKKFSILTAEHNGKSIFKGEHKDKNGNTGLKKIMYLTWAAAKRECMKQHKKLFNDRFEVDKFIEFFPWDNEEEKMLNFIQMFDLEKAWLWNPDTETWEDVHTIGKVMLTKYKSYDFSDICGIRRKNDTAETFHQNQRWPIPVVAYEDVE